MIPTSFTGSSPPTAVVGGSFSSSLASSSPLTGSNNASSSSSSSSAGGVQGNNSALLGIASLILEGRALAEDEYAVAKHQDVGIASGINAMECGRQSPKPSTSRAAATFHDHQMGGSSGASGGGLSTDIAGYLRRKASNSPESSSQSSSSLLRDYYNSNSSSESASSSVESNHSRWTQKLSQLRQESPNAQRHHLTAGREQSKVAVECMRSVEPEYVALAINTDQPLDERRSGGSGDFEIIRRIALNRINHYNSPVSGLGASSVSGGGGAGGAGGGGGVGGSVDNFMCSLQSLASNTCLRVGTPILSNPITASTPKYPTYRVTHQNTPRFPAPHYNDVTAGSASSSGSGVGGGIQSPMFAAATPWHQHQHHHHHQSATPLGANNKEYMLRKSSTERIAIPTPQTTTPTNSANTSCNSTYNSYGFSRRECPVSVTMTAAATSATTTTPTTSRNSTTPQQGPHCDQFLRKMGLAKGDASETEEHHCDMSYVNITCTRWRAYCIKMENILARGEPICIEVYLGPVGHKILLEQWIISVNEKQPPPTMTLPSLCSAIRSQLYFSQISAWCDLIKKSDKTIYDTGRLIFTTPPTMSAAGDLATTAANVLSTSPSGATTMLTMTSLPSPSGNSGSAVGSGGGGITSPGSSSNSSGVSSTSSMHRRPPRLNIFYRIKPYDNGNACFNSKPNVHNFPNVNISENCCVSVCLKSLPRITGGIPKVGPTTTTTGESIATAANSLPSAPSTPTTTTMRGGAAAASGTWSMRATPRAASTPMSAGAANITTTTNANKPTTKNCDNANSKEHHQQQQQKLQQTAVLNLNRAHSCDDDDDGHANDGEGDNDDGNAVNHDSGSIENYVFQQDNGAQSSSALRRGNSAERTVGGAVGDSCDLQCNVLTAGGADGDSSNSSLSTNYGNLSHREKQLLKYRKRMLKRDKKQQQQRKSNECNNSQASNGGAVASLKMEQGEEYDDDDDDQEGEEDDLNEASCNNSNADYAQKTRLNSSNASATNTTTKGQRQQQQLPNSFLNSIPFTNGQQQQAPPSKRTQESNQSQQHVKMISTGTQTTGNNNSNNNNANSTCSSCGYEKSMICLKCNPLKKSLKGSTPHSSSSSSSNSAGNVTIADDFTFSNDEGMDAESAESPVSSRSASSSSSVCSLSSSDIIHTPRNKAELLLQAIQRTPKSNKKLKITKDLQQQQQQQQQQQNQKQQHTTTMVKTNKTPATTSRSSTATNSHSGHLNRSMPSNKSLSSSSSSSLSGGGSTIQLQSCQVCKRQKTQHNFQQPPLASLEVATGEDCSSSPLESSAACSSSLLRCSQTSNGGNKTDDVLGEAENELDGGKMFTAEDCVDKGLLLDIANNVTNQSCDTKKKKSADIYKESEVMEEEYFVSSTKLTPHIERCSIATKTYYSQLHQQPSQSPSTNGTDTQRLCSTPPLVGEHNSENAKGQGLVMAQFKTPTPSEQQIKSNMNRQVQQQPHKQTPKPNLLQIGFSFNGGEMPAQSSQTNNNQIESNVMPSIHNPLLARRNSPKVNLTRIFCNPTSMKVSSPIPIGNGNASDILSTPSTASVSSGSKSADINVCDEVAPTFSFESPAGQPPTITVQKSNSAPTLPNSPSLSPRFIKASALYKRRSRHLSDRSDRSSLGSDEQFSDEDIDCGMYSPFATSPVKLRTRLSAVFGRKPMLGNLEESLLQRRLKPKIEVMGFKLLLGASGGFCPTQLTIPAAAYFYELQGETLSTPYLCEIRLPRKGYSVPRCGTVQATLLNPMGTVVRMFVIPYDMRDMPALHQTFVRQRILADSGNSVQTTSTSRNGGVIDAGDGVCVSEGVLKCSDTMVQNGNIQNFNSSTGVVGGAGDNATINTTKMQQQPSFPQNNFNTSNNNNNNNNTSNVGNMENHLGHFISAENMKSLRYSIHLRFQTSRSGRLMLHTDIRLLISRRTDCDTAAAHAKGVLEAPNELITNTVMPTNPKYSARQDQTTSSKI
ncbi:protein Atossa [Stomoxys calcitrans]|uniref:protein Atossa n=1 Tax=Stomoxys calcitrans TaxID=35570 RepID=UPI0027E34848|nr:protein Atossa [Stomoxys calcitrans]XP_013113615.2 protein Atossa [Stomoxys calcitrans]XP_013113622.2 protein Atossa [Stomoxys calcitrans]